MTFLLTTFSLFSAIRYDICLEGKEKYMLYYEDDILKSLKRPLLQLKK
jgi:hypothetical protein